MKINAVSYARFSSNNQRETSIEIQQEHINRYCQENGITIIKEYVDRAMTATSDNRPQFQQMIKDAESGLFSFVVIYNSSRFCRNIQDHLRYKSILESFGIRIISVQESFDETTPEGDLMSNFMMSINQFYSKDLGRKTYLGCLETAKACKSVGGRPPYGYRVNKDQKYEIVEEEAEVVRLLFKRTAEGISIRQICQELDEKGLKDRKGKPFTIRISSILTSRKYLGEFVWNQRQKSKIMTVKDPDLTSRGPSSVIRIPGGMPRIIDDETFDKVQEIVKKRTKNKGGPRTEYLLSSIVKCGVCGYRMSADRDINGNGRNSYLRLDYRCYSASRRRADCDTKAIRMQNLDTYIMNLVFGVLLNERYSKQIFKMIKTKVGREYDASIKSMTENQVNINKTSLEIKNLIASLAEARSIAYQEIVKEIERLTLLREDLEKEKAKIRDSLEGFPIFNEGVILEKIETIKSTIKAKTQEYLRPAIRLLVKDIFVTNEQVKVVINLNAYLRGNCKKDIEMVVVEETENIKRPDNQFNQRLSWQELIIEA